MPDRTIRDERVLRTFFLWAVDPAVARDYFEAEAAVTQRYLDRLQDIADTVEFRDTGPDRFRRIALEDGLRRSAAYVEWAAWATGLLVAVAAALEALFHWGDVWREKRSAGELLKIEGWRFFVRFLRSSTVVRTAISTPRFRSIGFMPAATALAPSRAMA